MPVASEPLKSRAPPAAPVLDVVPPPLPSKVGASSPAQGRETPEAAEPRSRVPLPIQNTPKEAQGTTPQPASAPVAPKTLASGIPSKRSRTPEAVVAGLLAVGVIAGGIWYFIGDKTGKVDQNAPPPPASAPAVPPVPKPVEPAASPLTTPAPALAPTTSPMTLPEDDTAQKAGEAQKAKEAARQQQLRRKKAEDAKRLQDEQAQRKAEETKRVQASEEKSRREAEEARRRAQQQAQPAPAPAQPRGPRTPQESCADRTNFVSRGICETRACERPEFRNQAYCVQMRERKQQQPSGSPSGQY
jgi:hypothetical protein